MMRHPRRPFAQPPLRSDSVMNRSKSLRRILLVLLAIAIAVLALVYLIPGEIDGKQQKAGHAILALGGLAVIISWTWLGPRTRSVALLLLSILSVANTLRWSSDRLSSIDHHDVVCYYLGGKYSKELSSFYLYPALVEADRHGLRYASMKANYWSQSRSGFAREPIKNAKKEGQLVRKERFEPSRWEEFEKDTRYFQNEMGRGRFRSLLSDKGFNATPAWLSYAGPVMNLVPPEQVHWIAKADLLFLGGALVLVGTTFGLNTALFALFFFCVSISSKWLTPGSVLFRYDWLSLLLVSMCLLKKKHYKLSGLLTALSGTLRLFPLVWIYGPAARLVTTWVTSSRQDRVKRALPLLSMLIVFGLSTLAIEGAAIVSVGKEVALDQAVKMGAHTSPEMISSKRPGFALALSYNGEFERTRLRDSQRKRIRQQIPLRYGISAVLLLALGWGLRKRDDAEAYAYGYVPFFLLATGTYYYHIARLTLVVMHASNLARLRNRVGLGLLLLLEVYSNLVFFFIETKEVFWTGWLSWGLTFYCFTMTIWLLREARREEISV